MKLADPQPHMGPVDVTLPHGFTGDVERLRADLVAMGANVRSVKREDPPPAKDEVERMNTASDRVAGIVVGRLARRLWGALGQVGPRPPIVVRWTGKRGRVGGRARRQPPPLVTLRIGNDCDRAAVMMVLLHELTHVALGPNVEAHGRAFNELLVKTAAIVWRVSVPTRGLGYKPSRALEDALRAMLGRRAMSAAKMPAPAAIARNA